MVLFALGPPGGGGAAVLRAVRSQGWPTPIILVTGDGEEPRGPEWLAAGPAPFTSSGSRWRAAPCSRCSAGPCVGAG